MAETDVLVESRTPTSDMDIWSDEVLTNPYPYYRQLRDLGPAVWLTKHGVWVVPRYSSIREALLNWEVFTSKNGTAMNAVMNQAVDGILLLSGEPEHQRLRRTFVKPLQPQTLKKLQDRLTALAEQRVEELLGKGEFDAVADLAQFLPLSVVTELLGLGEEGKKHMLRWGLACSMDKVRTVIRAQLPVLRSPRRRSPIFPISSDPNSIRKVGARHCSTQPTRANSRIRKPDICCWITRHRRWTRR